MNEQIFAVFGLPGGTEWIVILIIGLLLFGRRLPDVARSVGKSIVEFKKGIKDVRDDVETHSDSSAESRRPPQIDQRSAESTNASRERQTTDADSGR